MKCAVNTSNNSIQVDVGEGLHVQRSKITLDIQKDTLTRLRKGAETNISLNSINRLSTSLCYSHLQPLGGANTPIFSSTPAGKHNASPWFESIWRGDNKCILIKKKKKEQREDWAYPVTTTFGIQWLHNDFSLYLKLLVSCHLRLTVLHHVRDGPGQLNKDAGADGGRSKTWTPSIPLGTDNHIPI